MTNIYNYIYFCTFLYFLLQIYIEIYIIVYTNFDIILLFYTIVYMFLQ